jgi:hypothetical protein
MSPRSEPGGTVGDAYAVCLECGKRFAYDLKEMRFKPVGDTVAGTTEPLEDR